MAYNIEEHTHRFAVWTAARAAQRGFVSTGTISKAIEATNLQARLREQYNNIESEEDFDIFHKSMATELMQRLKEQVQIDGTAKRIPAEKITSIKEKATYGRAAKIIAIYIKTAYILRFPNSNLSQLAHPPIDRILLIAIAADRSANFQPPAKGWTQFDENDYKNVISSLRSLKNQKNFERFWEIECFWNPTGKKALNNC